MRFVLLILLMVSCGKDESSGSEAKSDNDIQVESFAAFKCTENYACFNDCPLKAQSCRQSCHTNNTNDNARTNCLSACQGIETDCKAVTCQESCQTKFNETLELEACSDYCANN